MLPVACGRFGLPLPARRGARVDLMHVMADIGDMQTVNARNCDPLTLSTLIAGVPYAVRHREFLHGTNKVILLLILR